MNKSPCASRILAVPFTLLGIHQACLSLCQCWALPSGRQPCEASRTGRGTGELGERLANLEAYAVVFTPSPCPRPLPHSQSCLNIPTTSLQHSEPHKRSSVRVPDTIQDTQFDLNFR